MSNRRRLRDLGIQIGTLETGPNNNITDVPGVLVGMYTLISDDPVIARTGVTAILPRANIHEDAAFAGFHSFNGIGEMAGQHFLEETGRLSSPVVLTCTHQLGLVYQSVLHYGVSRFGGYTFTLPVVGETHDGLMGGPFSCIPRAHERMSRRLRTLPGTPEAQGRRYSGCSVNQASKAARSRRIQFAVSVRRVFSNASSPSIRSKYSAPTEGSF